MRAYGDSVVVHRIVMNESLQIFVHSNTNFFLQFLLKLKLYSEYNLDGAGAIAQW